MVEGGVVLRSSDAAVFRAYMIRCMKNLAASQMARSVRWQPELDDAGEATGPSGHARGMHGDAVEIDKLAFRDARLVAMRAVLGLSFSEIARVLGADSQNALRVRHGRALTRLAASMGS
jgi:DNA-directed RNA polymerase specialized sigma24 family protein